MVKDDVWCQRDDWLCERCTFTYGRTAYNFRAALERMHGAVGKDNFIAIAEREKLLLESYGLDRLPQPEPQEGWPQRKRTVDRSANRLIRNRKELKDLQALAVKADGNCFYNSLCKAIYDDETNSTHLRLLVALEIVMNPERYDKKGAVAASYIQPEVLNEFDEISSLVSNTCNPCGVPAAYATIAHFFAASEVLGQPIRSTHPLDDTEVFGCALHLPYTTTAHGQTVSPLTEATLHLLWSRTDDGKEDQPMSPREEEREPLNHIVPLVPRTSYTGKGKNKHDGQAKGKDKDEGQAKGKKPKENDIGNHKGSDKKHKHEGHDDKKKGKNSKSDKRPRMDDDGKKTDKRPRTEETDKRPRTDETDKRPCTDETDKKDDRDMSEQVCLISIITD